MTHIREEEAYGSNGGNVGADPKKLVAIFGPPMEL